MAAAPPPPLDEARSDLFSSSPRSRLEADRKLGAHLATLAAKTGPEWDTAKRAGAYLSFVLSGRSEQQQLPPTSSTSTTPGAPQRVMVSYSWANQAVGRKVDEYLTQRGFVVWRDEKNMKGDIIDAMTSAVLLSDVIVALVSESYFKSANCQTEFKFAHNNKKCIVPILAEAGYSYTSNWIGLILGGALYYEAVPDAKFESAMAALVAKELAESSADRRASRRASGALALQPPPQEEAPADPVAVRAWLEAVALGDVYESLEREGFVDKRFAKLKRFPAAELKALFGLSTSQRAGNDSFNRVRRNDARQE